MASSRMAFFSKCTVVVASLLSPAVALISTGLRSSVRGGADPCDLKNALDLSGKVISSNLGGVGPDPEAPEGIFYENVIPFASQMVDLEVTVASGEYHSENPSLNGNSHSYGIINVMAKSFVNLRFRFVDHVTRESVYNPDPFYFSVYDLDKGLEKTGIESVYFGKGIRYIVDNNTELLREESADYTRYIATMYGNLQDNPTNPLASTPTQLQRTVSLLIPAGSEFQLTFQVEGGKQSRNFMFAGPSPLVCPIRALCSSFTCPSGELRQDAAYIVCADKTCDLHDTATCCCSPDTFGHFDAADLIESSLGESAAGKISFDNIAAGTNIVMKVTAANDFSKINPSKSGTHGSFGMLNVFSGSSISFRFSFKDRVTGLPSPLPPFRMAIMDIDESPQHYSLPPSNDSGSDEPIHPFLCQERVHVTNFTNYRLYQDGAHIRVQTTANGDTDILSKEIGGTSNDPSYYLDLSDDEKGLSVNFEFPSLSEFYVTFSVGAGCKWSRSIEFTKPMINGQC